MGENSAKSAKFRALFQDDGMLEAAQNMVEDVDPDAGVSPNKNSANAHQQGVAGSTFVPVSELRKHDTLGEMSCTRIFDHVNSSSIRACVSHLWYLQSFFRCSCHWRCLQEEGVQYLSVPVARNVCLSFVGCSLFSGTVALSRSALDESLGTVAQPFGTVAQPL